MPTFARTASRCLPYIVGRKGLAYYRFRDRVIAGEWSGFSESPSYAHAKEIADALITAFNTPTDEGGVDEIHVCLHAVPLDADSDAGYSPDPAP